MPWWSFRIKHTTDESRRQIQNLSMADAWGLWHSAQLRPDYWRSQPGWSKMLQLYGIFIWCIYIYSKYVYYICIMYIYIYIYYLTCDISEHTKRQASNKRTWDHRFKLRNAARSSSLSWFCVYAGHEQSRLASRRTDVRQIRDVQRLPWCHSVCVWTIWIDVKLQCFFQFTKAGGPSMYCERWSNEAATVHADITADHRDVPAFFMLLFSCHFFHVNFMQWDVAITREPPCRFQTTCFQLVQEVTIRFRWKCCI